MRVVVVAKVVVAVAGNRVSVTIVSSSAAVAFFKVFIFWVPPWWFRV